VIRDHTTAKVVVAGVFATALAIGASAPAGASGWAQYGGRVRTWFAVHVIDAKGCPSGPCYGPRVHSAAQPFEYTHVTSARGRIDGYDEALRNVTAQQAELRVRSQLPPDAEIGSLTVHHDRFGQSCAYVNFQSKTLKAWFGPNLLAGQGTVGVELVSVAAQGRVTYDPTRVNLLIVTPIYLGSQDNC
jgi:hypothetical protein